MMEKTLILKHILWMLCLLISYSKFTRTCTYKSLLQKSTRYIIMKKYIFQNLSVVIFRRHLPVIISAKAKEVEDFLRFIIYHIKNGGA